MKAITISFLTFALLLVSVHSCVPGQFEDPFSNLCQPCPDNSFSIDGNSTSCENCTFCVDCDSITGDCTACQPGQQPRNGTCQPCPNLFFSSSGLSLCQSCDSSCLTCNITGGECTSCHPNMGLSQGICQACAMTQFQNASTFICQDCDPSCLTCNGPMPSNCLSCNLDFGFENNSCTFCENGTSDGLQPCTFCSTANCSVCNVNDICQICETGLTLLPNQQCGYPCGSIIQNCQLCQSNNICFSCNTNFTLVQSSNTCHSTQCNIDNCLACLSNSICSSCGGGLQISTNQAVCLSCNASDCVSCSRDDFCDVCVVDFGAVEGVCYLCGVNHCTNCDNSGSNLRCLNCQLGYSIDTVNNFCSCDLCSVANCVRCGEPDVCSVCEANYTLDNGTCVDNCGIDFCVVCVNNTCQACVTDYILLGSSCERRCLIQNCLTCSQTSLGQCQTCSTGYSPSQDNSSCVLCNIANCNSCISDNICGQCNGSLLFQSGICLSCLVDNCQRCSADNVCITCKRGYNLKRAASSIQNQCFTCLDPCASCFSDGSCQSCLTPFSQILLTQGQNCFLCDDPRCINCLDGNAGSCSICTTGFSLVNGTCQQICSTGCQNCSSSTVCNTCFSVFVYLSNNKCPTCPNSPACVTCMPSNPNTCTLCNNGYYLSVGNCLPCQSYCKTCTSATLCTTLYNQNGFTLISINATHNAPASCSKGCMICSGSNPAICSQCKTGLYLTQEGICRPCTAASLCASCLPSNPAQCLSCYPGTFIGNNSVCISCSFPCTSCTNNNPNECSTCAQGYVLIISNKTCELSSNIASTFNIQPIDNCANSQLRSVNGSNSIVCSLCLQGYALTSAGCVPCASGCQVCNPADFTNCIQCAPGFELDGNNVCVRGTSCPSNCDSCTSIGCLSCTDGYFLNQNFKCQVECVSPCATCDVSNPLSCVSCVKGYLLQGGNCVTDTSCNANADCVVCPQGFALLVSSDATRFNQTCIACSSSSNCAQCLASTPSQCTSCSYGFFLNGTICSGCPQQCADCISLTQCMECSPGFVAISSGTLQNSEPTGILNCTTCASPCSNCRGSTSSCTSCVSGFTLVGDVCLSQFNYVIQCVFSVTLAEFQSNYLGFLQQASAAAGVAIKNIVVVSITSGSVITNLQVTSFNAPGSSAAIQDQTNLNTLLSSGNIANMPVSSFALSTEGGSNTIPPAEDDGGLSTTTIIILATVIPIGSILLLGGIFLIYAHKKKKDEKMKFAPKWKYAEDGIQLGPYSTPNRERNAFL